MVAKEGHSNAAGGLEWTAVDLPTPANSVVGTTVGKYDILEEIGRGGMGVVYLARQRGLERNVALKALHAATGWGLQSGEALVKESRIAGSLSHPNIVTVYEFLEEGHTPYIAMEYVQRGSLRPWMGAMSTPQFIGVFEELLAGLAAVEPSGIVHRDLKPENVMVTADGRVKIADFGIAKATQRAGSLSIASTPTGITVGTPAYMAPEQALCDDVGPATDLYSIGIMAYEHLVGRVPFRDSKTPMAILLSHINDPVPDAADVEPRVDRLLSDWVARLLVKDPGQRTQNASIAWDELEDIAIGRLGPMWRREARLTEKARTRITPRRLDPAQFNSQTVTMGPAPAVDTVRRPTIDPAPRAETVRRTPLAPTWPVAERTLERSARQVPVRKDQAPIRSGRRTVPLLGAAAAIAVLGGFGMARATATKSGSHTTRAGSGAVSVAVPVGWVTGSASKRVAGYEFKTPVALSPTGGAGGITVGITNAASAALLPASALGGGAGTPRAEPVHLGQSAFFRYRGGALSVSGQGQVIYTQPTTAGVLVGVCHLPASGGAKVDIGCEQILASVRIASGEALSLGQSSTYATQLAQTVSTLNSELKLGAGNLARASSPISQSTAATRLGRATTIAARHLRAARPGSSERPVNGALVEALDRMAAGYATMAAAARGNKAHSWLTGAAEVRTAENAVRGSLGRLSTAG